MKDYNLSDIAPIQICPYTHNPCDTKTTIEQIKERYIQICDYQHNFALAMEKNIIAKLEEEEISFFTFKDTERLSREDTRYFSPAMKEPSIDKGSNCFENLEYYCATYSEHMGDFLSWYEPLNYDPRDKQNTSVSIKRRRAAEAILMPDISTMLPPFGVILKYREFFSWVINGKKNIEKYKVAIYFDYFRPLDDMRIYVGNLYTPLKNHRYGVNHTENEIITFMLGGPSYANDEDYKDGVFKVKGFHEKTEFQYLCRPLFMLKYYFCVIMK